VSSSPQSFMNADNTKTRTEGGRKSPSTERRLPAFFVILGFAAFSLVLLAPLLELTSWAIWSAYHRGPYPFEEQATSPVYAGDARASEYWREESRRFRLHRPYVPYRVWGVTEWHGKYMNADAGDMGILRRTVNPSDSKCQHQTRSSIWVFGGSTVYGQFVPDWATLPSYLSRNLNTAGAGCVIVHNLGVEGYVTNQELILLMEQLKKGRHPDVVIFYDGLNDAGAALEAPDPANAHGTLGVIKARIEESPSARLDFLRESYTGRVTADLLKHFRAVRRSPFAGDAHAQARAVLDNYEANMQLAGVLSKAYNFTLYRFWQPTLVYGHKPLVPFEQQILLRDESSDSPHAAWLQTTLAVYQEAESRAARGRDFVFLGDVFDSDSEPVYIDEGHLGPLGNELAAQAVAKYIEDHPGN
jgi:lysophospholipase L1-like esterase